MAGHNRNDFEVGTTIAFDSYVYAPKDLGMQRTASKTAIDVLSVRRRTDSSCGELAIHAFHALTVA